MTDYDSLQETDAGEWLFAKDSLASLRGAARERAAQVLMEARQSDPPRPLGLEEGLRLVVFYCQKLPELCNLCSAPSEVRWTAVVLFRRFFALSSPMEFDPLPMMFASVHVACKVEEAREITLDRLLEAGGFGEDEAMKAKISDLELDLLEGVGFSLLVEPKPGSALRMLSEDLREFNPAALPPKEDSTTLAKLLERAEAVSFDLGMRTDALLHWPMSVIISAAFSTALDERGVSGGKHHLHSMLASGIQSEKEKQALLDMIQEVLQLARQVCSEQDLDKSSVQETAKAARKCHQAFECLRQERKERLEAQHKARKRRRHEMKMDKRRGVPTPMLQENNFADLKRKAAALQSADGQEDSLAARASASTSASPSNLAIAAPEEFIIHRPQDMDLEDD